jgi:guanylate cyclase
VIGTSKFSYDLWGDAVNLASRMEQFGIPGEIQTTEATYALLNKLFEFEPRGNIAIKGKGKVQAYLLKARKHV